MLLRLLPLLACRSNAPPARVVAEEPDGALAGGLGSVLGVAAEGAASAAARSDRRAAAAASRLGGRLIV